MLPLTKKGRAESPLLVTGGAALPPSAEAEEPTEDEVAGDVLLDTVLEPVVFVALAAEEVAEADFIEPVEELATELVLSGPAATALAARAAAACPPEPKDC